MPSSHEFDVRVCQSPEANELLAQVVSNSDQAQPLWLQLSCFNVVAAQEVEPGTSIVELTFERYYDNRPGSHYDIVMIAQAFSEYFREAGYPEWLEINTQSSLAISLLGALSSPFVGDETLKQLVKVSVRR